MGKKKAGPTRTTISLPSELKQRMDRVGEPVNWSAVAAAAFEEKLASITAKKQRKNRMDVIERLRASRRKSDVIEFQDGEQVGRRWAIDEAEAVELENLSAFIDRLRGYEEETVYEPTSSAYSGAETVFFAIAPDCDRDRSMASDFWERVLGEGHVENAHRPEFLRGFVHGSLALWNEVRDEL